MTTPQLVCEIATILRNQARNNRVIPFARFMEFALYCPELGYYECLDHAPGRSGDYYTSVSVGPMFGRLLAAQFAEWLKPMASDRLRLIEAGAHDGQLALDILSWFEGTNSPLWPRLEYGLIEPSARRRAWQAEKLARFAARIQWFDSPSDPKLGSVHGIFFSNELLDAFPVTRLKWKASGQQWVEMGVAWSDDADQFVWEEMPISRGRIDEILGMSGLSIPSELARVLPDGFTADVALSATPWWTEAARALAHGVLMTTDYGLTAEELLSPSRTGGTLRAYRHHHLEPNVLAFPGEQDLTSHVNFSQLRLAGEAAGLKTAPLISQSEFLTRIAARFWQDGVGIPSAADVRQFNTLAHPEHLGSRFRVFVQNR
jgi:SAM-dependent MidA family methyltransferase